MWVSVEVIVGLLKVFLLCVDKLESGGDCLQCGGHCFVITIGMIDRSLKLISEHGNAMLIGGHIMSENPRVTWLG